MGHKMGFNLVSLNTIVCSGPHDSNLCFGFNLIRAQYEKWSNRTVPLSLWLIIVQLKDNCRVM